MVGVLGDDESFRLRVCRTTRGGRPLRGYYPNKVFIAHDQVQLEQHLEDACQSLKKNQIKPMFGLYCQVRRSQREIGEEDNNRERNEIAAARLARQTVLQEQPHSGHIPESLAFAQLGYGAGHSGQSGRFKERVTAPRSSYAM